MKEPISLQEAIVHFSNPDNCLRYIVARRWPDGVVCPTCNGSDVRFLPTRRLWECKAKHAKRQFSAKIGTVMEDSAIGLDKWLVAMWMIANCRNGVSSYEIHRAVKVTQKSAWFMLHRLRLAMQAQPSQTLGGDGCEVEADEAFIGARAKNMHKSRKLALQRIRNECVRGDTRLIGKTAVMGVLDREQRKVRATVVPAVNRETLQNAILKHVHHGSKIYTDEATIYNSVPKEYIHAFVNHMERYVDGRIHTNGLENFWSLLKRQLNGTYIAVEPFHLFRYVDEQAWRYNHRLDSHGNKLSDAARFSAAVSQITGKRLTFAEVTGKVGVSEKF